MLIIDMPMPKGCYFCPMSATYPTDWYCMAYDNTKSIEGCAPMNKRPDWCPIKGILPDEHGDLIDRDKAIFEMCEGLAPMRYRVWAHRYLQSEKIIPTVIAAERKEE